MQEPASLIIAYMVFPLWVAAGFCDWICHRRTGIAFTSGLKENLLHWLMFAEVGAGMLAVALLEINAAVLLLLLAVFLMHELTVYRDLAYGTLQRDVGPFEQMVHSFLEMLPLLALALLAVSVWPQSLALVGMGEEPLDLTLRLKEEPLPGAVLAGGLVASLVFNVLPLLQETWSCALARKSRRTSVRQAGAAGVTAHTPPNPEPK